MLCCGALYSYLKDTHVEVPLDGSDQYDEPTPLPEGPPLTQNTPLIQNRPPPINPPPTTRGRNFNLAKFIMIWTGAGTQYCKTDQYERMPRAIIYSTIALTLALALECGGPFFHIDPCKTRYIIIIIEAGF